MPGYGDGDCQYAATRLSTANPSSAMRAAGSTASASADRAPSLEHRGQAAQRPRACRSTCSPTSFTLPAEHEAPAALPGPRYAPAHMSGGRRAIRRAPARRASAGSGRASPGRCRFSSANPPTLVSCGSTTPCTNAQVTAASMALPPRARTSAPASTASASGAAIIAPICSPRPSVEVSRGTGHPGTAIPPLKSEWCHAGWQPCGPRGWIGRARPCVSRPTSAARSPTSWSSTATAGCSSARSRPRRTTSRGPRRRGSQPPLADGRTPRQAPSRSLSTRPRSPRTPSWRAGSHRRPCSPPAGSATCWSCAAPAPRSSTTSSGRLPPPLVPRHLRLEVDERILADGSVATPLDEASVERGGHAGGRSRRRGDRHLLPARVPQRRATSGRRPRSSDAPGAGRLRVALVGRSAGDRRIRADQHDSRQRRASARSSSATSAACARHLGAAGIDAPVFLMQSNGGVMSLAAARDRPAAIVESGPAAGVDRWSATGVGDSGDRGSHHARHGRHDDEGGTDRGRPSPPDERVRDGRRDLDDRRAWSRPRATRCACRSSTSPKSARAAGRSSASPPTAALRVGPESAGAVPGPAAYGLGGDGGHGRRRDARPRLSQPDAASPAARSALHAGPRRGGHPSGTSRSRSGVDAATAAYGVFRVAVATMARAVKAVTTYRGRSPSAFSLARVRGQRAALRGGPRARARDPAA